MAEPEERMLAFEETLERLGLKRAELYRQMAEGAIQGAKNGRMTEFAESEVARFEEKRDADRAALEEGLEHWLAFFAERLSGRDGEVPEPLAEDATADDKAAELVRRLLEDALDMGASDVHLDPIRDGERLLYRIRGNLKEIARLPAPVAAMAKAKLKALAPALPESAEAGVAAFFTREHRGKGWQGRIRAAATLLGEHVHAQLREDDLADTLEGLGYSSAQGEAMRRLLTGRPGLVLLAAPGDPFAERHRLALAAELASSGRLVLSLERHPGYRSELLVQLEAGGDGADFAALARMALEMNPEVLLLDDVHNADEAQWLLEGVAAGATVVAQIRQVGAVEALLKLAGLGLSREALARSLLCVVERVSLRRVCLRCADKAPLGEEHAKRLYLEPGVQVSRPASCDVCGDGFLGRRMVFGAWVADDALRKGILAMEAPGAPLREWNAANPLSLAHAAADAVLSGEVFPEDALALSAPPEEGAE